MRVEGKNQGALREEGSGLNFLYQRVLVSACFCRWSVIYLFVGRWSKEKIVPWRPSATPFSFLPHKPLCFYWIFCTEQASFLRGDTTRCVSGLWAVERVRVWAHSEALWMSWPSLRRAQGLCVSVDGEGGQIYTRLPAQCGIWVEHGELLNPTLSISPYLTFPFYCLFPSIFPPTHINTLFWSLPALWCWYLA